MKTSLQKISLSVIAVIALVTTSQAQCIGNVNIPDANLKAALVADTLVNTNQDTEIQCTEAEAYAGELSLKYRQIADATGLEKFINVTGLNISNNNLTSLDVSDNTELTLLYCDYNSLTSLQVSGAIALKSIVCSYNQLTSLDVSANIALEELDCHYNSLTSIDVSTNSALEKLNCERNSLTSIEVSGATALTAINCNYNLLLSIDVSANTALEKLSCRYNSLTSLDVSANTTLTSLSCGENSISSLDVSANLAIDTLACSDNQLTSLDVSGNTALVLLSCHENQLTSIDVSNNSALKYFSCGYNSLTSLSVSTNTDLEYFSCHNNSLTHLNVANNNNANLTWIEMIHNPDLSCIQVDDVDGDHSSWYKDNTAEYKEDCYVCLVNIPDAKLKTALLQNTAVNTNQDTEIQCNEAEAYLGALYLSGLQIADATGLEAFTNLTELQIYSNNLTNLDVSANTALTAIRCNNNSLSSLDVSANTALTVLYCQNNSLTSLNAANNNNVNMYWVEMNNNPNLSCIQVDDEVGDHSSWVKDATAAYSEDCNVCLVNIPDANLKTVLLQNTAVNTNQDTEIQCTEAEAYAGLLDLSGLQIEDATGLEAFTNLTELQIYSNKLSSLDLSANTALTFLHCGNNSLLNLDVSANTALTALFCSYNRLTSLDVSANTALTELSCRFNSLLNLNVANNNNANMTEAKMDSNTSLDCIQVDDENGNHSLWWKDLTAEYSENCICIVYIPNTNLKTSLLADTLVNTNQDSEIQCAEAEAYTGALNLSDRQISDVTGLEKFINVTVLNISDNNLTSLGVSANTALTELFCSDNYLTSLDVSANTALEELYCGYNLLTSLDVSNNTELKLFTCTDNYLKNLDVSNNTALTELYCGYNSLTSLDVSDNSALEVLVCFRNSLTSLDVSGAIALTELYCGYNSLTNLDMSANSALTLFYCRSNSLVSLNVANNNNVNLGEVFIDNNPDLYCVQVDNENDALTHGSWVATSQVLFKNDCGVGVSENQYSSTVTLYPNPTAGRFTVAVPASQLGTTLLLYNAVGKLVLQTSLLQSATIINIDNLSKGMYLVKTTNAQGNSTMQKLMAE
jgi:Leucine-rich repeat (LRR) protein